MYLILFLVLCLFVFSIIKTLETLQLTIGQILWADVKVGYKVRVLLQLFIVSLITMIPWGIERGFFYLSEIWRKSYVDQWWSYYTGKFDNIKNNPEHKEAFDIIQGVVYDTYPSLSGYEKFMFGRLIRAIGRKSGIEIHLEKELIPSETFVEILWENIGDREESWNGWRFLPETLDSEYKELMSPSGVVYACLIDTDGCVEKVEKL